GPGENRPDLGGGLPRRVGRSDYGRSEPDRQSDSEEEGHDEQYPASHDVPGVRIPIVLSAEPHEADADQGEQAPQNADVRDPSQPEPDDHEEKSRDGPIMPFVGNARGGSQRIRSASRGRGRRD